MSEEIREERKKIRETRPEMYLREIRDLQKQNGELLQKLYSAEEDKVSSKRWATMFHIATMLLPYAFSAYVSWVFYEKVQDTFNNLKQFIIDSPSQLTGNLKENFTGNINSVTEAGTILWENKNTLYDKGENLLKTYVGE